MEYLGSSSGFCDIRYSSCVSSVPSATAFRLVEGNGSGMSSVPSVTSNTGCSEITEFNFDHFL